MPLPPPDDHNVMITYRALVDRQRGAHESPECPICQIAAQRAIRALEQNRCLVPPPRRGKRNTPGPWLKQLSGEHPNVVLVRDALKGYSNKPDGHCNPEDAALIIVSRLYVRGSLPAPRGR